MRAKPKRRHGESDQTSRCAILSRKAMRHQVITSKYQYGLPLHRQEAMFKQYGIEMSRKTLSDWMLRAIRCRCCMTVQLAQPVHADETTVNVVSDDNVNLHVGICQWCGLTQR